jgi:ribosome biogenesis GTPase
MAVTGGETRGRFVVLLCSRPRSFEVSVAGLILREVFVVAGAVLTTPAEEGNLAVMKGLVTRAEGSRFWVGLEADEVPCVVRGRMKKKQLRVSGLIVVGDEVMAARLPDGTGVIEERLPRRTELSRPGFRGRQHIIAANLDQLLIVQSVHQPEFKRRLVERFLALARHGGMEALLVVNKCDLEEPRVVEALAAPLVAAGVRASLVSAFDGRGIPELRERLVGRVSCLAGQSGVGKSSLLVAMFPAYGVRTAEVNQDTGKGRHTTTSSRLYALPGGGYVADTPGIRELGLFEEVGDELGGVFPEIEAASAGCRFRDCSHTHEPLCAVKAAVETGDIDEDRYRNFVRLRRRA